MLGVYLDLRANEDWIRLVEAFTRKLRLRVPGVVKVVALASPEERVYDSNVLVVVEEEEELIERRVVDAAIEAEEETGMHGQLSPITCTIKEPLLERFIGGFTVEVEHL